MVKTAPTNLHYTLHHCWLRRYFFFLTSEVYAAECFRSYWNHSRMTGMGLITKVTEHLHRPIVPRICSSLLYTSSENLKLVRWGVFKLWVKEKQKVGRKNKENILATTYRFPFGIQKFWQNRYLSIHHTILNIYWYSICNTVAKHVLK